MEKLWAVCTEWEDNNGTIIKTELEREVYKTLRKIIKALCIGKIYSSIWLGKDTYQQWKNERISIAYDLNNLGCYNFDDFTLF